MSTPVQSVRVAPENKDVLQAVVGLLRQGRADDLRRLLKTVDDRPIGGFRSEQAAVTFLVGRLVTALRPREVWLFGSRARGDHRPDSDFDLLVVLPDGLDEACYTSWHAGEPVAGCGLPVDVIACAASDFAAEAVPEDILAAVKREGRRLYQRRTPRGAGHGE